MLLVCAVAVPAFAAEDTGSESSDYDYMKDPRLTEITNYKDGEFAWGGYAPCMYQIVTKEFFTLNNLPVYEEDEIETELQDTVSIDPIAEGVSLNAFYVFKCPKCGKALGGDRLSAIYGGNHNGKCSHCEELLPDPSTVKIYRFIVVPKSSAHYDALKVYDFASEAGAIYGETAKLYGDGKDLPQSNLIYETDEDGNTVLVDFYTDGNHVETKDGFMAKLFLFLVRFQYKVTPTMERFAVSKYNEVVFKMRLAILHLNEKILTALVTL